MDVDVEPFITHQAAQAGQFHPGVWVIVVAALQCPEEWFVVFHNNGDHVDAGSLVVVLAHAAKQRRFFLYCRMLLYPSLALLVSLVFHATKIVVLLLMCKDEASLILFYIKRLGKFIVITIFFVNLQAEIIGNK